MIDASRRYFVAFGPRLGGSKLYLPRLQSAQAVTDRPQYWQVKLSRCRTAQRRRTSNARLPAARHGSGALKLTYKTRYDLDGLIKRGATARRVKR